MATTSQKTRDYQGLLIGLGFGFALGVAVSLAVPVCWPSIRSAVGTAIFKLEGPRCPLDGCLLGAPKVSRHRSDIFGKGRWKTSFCWAEVTEIRIYVCPRHDGDVEVNVESTDWSAPADVNN